MERPKTNDQGPETTDLKMQFIRRLLNLFRRRKLDTDMAEEMRLHVELQTERNVAAGMKPDDARYAALRQFGNVASVQERAREGRGWVWLEQAGQDLRYAMRQLRRSPGFTAVAVLSLGLGIGANTAVFSVVHEVLLKSLPVKNPGELVLFHWTGGRGFGVPTSGDWETDPETQLSTCTSFSMRAFERFPEVNSTLTDVFAFVPIWRPTLILDGQAESSAGGQLVSGGYFSALGVSPLLGRLITPDDDRPDAEPVAVLSHAYWMKRFGGDPGALGKVIRVNGVAATIVGVMPREFIGALDVGVSPDVLVPLVMLPAVDTWLGPGARKVGAPWMLRVMGRRAEGKTSEQVQANFEGLFQSLAMEDVAAGPETRAGGLAEIEPPRLFVRPGGKGLNALRHSFERRLTILTGLVACVLLIACANVANLLLARGRSRRREIAARLALGASRGRLIRQLLTESALLLVLGGGAGLLLAEWGRSLATLPLTTEAGQPLVLTASLDAPVLVFALAVTVATGLLFGLWPALSVTRLDLNAGFQGAGRNPDGGSRLRLGKVLLGGQVAMAVVLLIGAGLFVRTLGKLDSVDLGFRPERLLLFRIDAVAGSADDTRAAGIHQRMVERIAAVPGVTSATFATMPLLSRAEARSLVRIPGRTPPPDAVESAMVNAVGPDYFQTLGLAVVRGREFTERDEAQAPKVGIVNQAFVKKYFDGQNPVGRQVFYRGRPGPQTPVEIVGVVADAKYADQRGEMPETLLVPFAQNAWSEGTYVVRTAADPEAVAAAIRAAVRAVDPTLPMADVRTLDAQLSRLSENERMFARLSSWFGGLALVLICVGLHGLISYGVARRTAEMGVRLALGALPRQVQWLVIRESLLPVGAGVVVGTVAAIAATRLVAGMLYGVSATDPLTYGAVAGLFLFAALLAAWLPARTAATVDPVVALRAE